MSRFMTVLFSAIGLAFGVSVLLCGLNVNSKAIAATPEPSHAVEPTGTPTPAVQAPIAPADVSLVGDIVSWTDSSNNEDGFDVDVRRCDFTFHQRVGPNITSVKLPPEWSSGEFCQTIRFTVTAFNAAGSAPTSRFIQIEAPGFANPRGGVQMPPTGEGNDVGALSVGSLASAGLSFLALAFILPAGLVIAKRRNRTKGLD